MLSPEAFSQITPPFLRDIASHFDLPELLTASPEFGDSGGVKYETEVVPRGQLALTVRELTVTVSVAPDGSEGAKFLNATVRLGYRLRDGGSNGMTVDYQIHYEQAASHMRAYYKWHIESSIYSSCMSVFRERFLEPQKEASSLVRDLISKVGVLPDHLALRAYAEPEMLGLRNQAISWTFKFNVNKVSAVKIAIALADIWLKRGVETTTLLDGRSFTTGPGVWNKQDDDFLDRIK